MLDLGIEAVNKEHAACDDAEVESKEAHGGIDPVCSLKL